MAKKFGYLREEPYRKYTRDVLDDKHFLVKHGWPSRKVLLQNISSGRVPYGTVVSKLHDLIANNPLAKRTAQAILVHLSQTKGIKPRPVEKPKLVAKPGNKPDIKK